MHLRNHYARTARGVRSRKMLIRARFRTFLPDSERRGKGLIQTGFVGKVIHGVNQLVQRSVISWAD
jgi:hypothetical protein